MLRHQDLIGKQIEEFRLDRFIDAGAMGMVFEAQDTVLNRKIALKLIRKGTEGFSEKEPFEARAIREAQAAARLSHPNIVAVYRYGETADFHYIGMELVRGRTLGRVLQERGKIPLEEAIPIFDQVLLALEAAAREQIVHRDIKPANIMVGPDQRIKVMDFGIAKIGFQASTVTGNVLGTPSYMSPEQVSGKKIDMRSDLFSLAAVLYQVVTGERPFQGDNLGALVYKLLHTEPVPVHFVNPDLPPTLWPIIRRALSKKPEDRFASPADMRAALSALKISGKVSVEETLRYTGEKPFPEAAQVFRQWLPRKKILVTGSLIFVSLIVLFLVIIAGIRWLGHHSGLPVPQGRTAPTVIPSVVPSFPSTPPASPLPSKPREKPPSVVTSPVSPPVDPRVTPPVLSPESVPALEAELQSTSGEVFTSPGKAVKLSIRIRNSGTRTWRPAEVRYVGFGGWSGREGPIWRTVAPGTSIDFNETVVVPRQPGRYYYGVILKSQGVLFSPQFYVLVQVVEG